MFKINQKLKFLSLEIGPNFQFDDAKIALKSIFYSSNKSQKHHQEKAQNWFKQNFDTRQVWFTETCRSGIYMLLKTLNLPKESEVLIQSFSCIVVPNAVLQSGLQPVVCDVSTDNFNFDLDKIESKITPNTKVWILQYNFGIIPDMDKVKKICDKYNLILIEDCAHSLGGEFKLEGNTYKIGTFGHAACFSFGRDKVISTTTGGATIIHDLPKFFQSPDITKLWSDRLNHEYEQLQEMSSKRTLENLIYPINTVFLIKPFYRFQLGKIVAYISKKLQLSGLVYSMYEKNGEVEKFPKPKQYSQRLYELLNNQLLKLDIFNQHRRNIASIYAKKLKLDYDVKNVYLRFPVYLKNLTSQDDIQTNKDIYTKIKTGLKRQGVFLGNWYTKAFLGVTDKYTCLDNQISLLKTTNKIIQNQVINLPTHINTTISDADYIADSILKII